MSRRSRAFALCMALACAGCVIPIPRQGFVETRANVPQAPPASITDGVTTRAEVLMQLGDPDARANDDSWFVFGAREHRGGVAFIMAAGGAMGGIGFDDYRYRRLVVTFDERGVVATATLEDKDCIDSWIAMGAAAGQVGRQCLDLTGADLAARQAQQEARSAVQQWEESVRRSPEPVVATAPHVFWTPQRHDAWSPAGLIQWGSVDVTGTSLIVRGRAEGSEPARVLLRLPLAVISAAECRDELMAPKSALAIQRPQGPPLLLVCVSSDAWWALGDAAACARLDAAIRAGRMPAN